jgi:hypothetical protein
VLAAIALVSLVVFGNTPFRSRLLDAIFDFAHVPVFGGLALVLRHLVRQGPDPRRDWIAMGGVLALGLLTEGFQAFQPYREASVSDLARDVAGGGAFLLLRGGRTRRVPLLLFAAALLAAASSDLARVIAVTVQRGRVMPVLARFDGSWWEREVVVVGRNSLAWPATPPGRDPRAPGLARLDLRPATYSGLGLDEPHGDWRGYDRFVMTVVSDLDVPLTLALRIHDAAHRNRYDDRFNTTIVVRPGENRISIPLDGIRLAPARREMDLRRIRGVILFVHNLDHPTHLYLGEMRLE